MFAVRNLTEADVHAIHVQYPEVHCVRFDDPSTKLHDILLGEWVSRGGRDYYELFTARVAGGRLDQYNLRTFDGRFAPVTTEDIEAIVKLQKAAFHVLVVMVAESYGAVITAEAFNNSGITLNKFGSPLTVNSFITVWQHAEVIRSRIAEIFENPEFHPPPVPQQEVPARHMRLIGG